MLVAFFSWWYGEGARRQVETISRRIASLFDLFSIELLVRTLFSPFRQISAGNLDGPIGVQFRAFIDKLISRFIGGLVRSSVLVAGCITIFVASILSVLQILFWYFAPFLPIVGLVLAMSGWLPWR